MIRIAQLESEARSSRDAAQLRELAGHSSKVVRWAVAGNPNTADDTIEHLLADVAGNVRLSAACNLADRPALHRRAVASPDPWVRACLAHTFARRDDRSLPYETQRALSVDEFYETRQRVAQTTNYADVFELLLADDDPRVRGWCAANPRVSLAHMERLITDRSKTVRSLAAAVGLQFPSDEQLVRLARDRSKEVRWAVLFRADRPREALEIIAEDPDQINRQHAQLALLDNAHIMASVVVESFREGRRRAAAAAPFETPPG